MRLTDLLPFLREDNDALIDKELRTFNKLKTDRSYDENVAILIRIINKHQNLIQSVLTKFTKLVTPFLPRHSSGKIEFVHQTKTMDSIINKVLDRDKPIEKMSDLVRGAVIFDNPSDQTEFLKDFRRKASSYIIDYEERTKGSDPILGYYGSVHIEMHIDGIDVELQVMPRKLWNYKDELHKVYTKWRSTSGPVDKFDSNRSKIMYVKGNTPNYSPNKRNHTESVQLAIKKLLC